MLKSPSGSSWSAARRSHAKASRAACSSNSSSPSTVPLPSPLPPPPKPPTSEPWGPRHAGKRLRSSAPKAAWARPLPLFALARNQEAAEGMSRATRHPKQACTPNSYCASSSPSSAACLNQDKASCSRSPPRGAGSSQPVPPAPEVPEAPAVLEASEAANHLASSRHAMRSSCSAASRNHLSPSSRSEAQPQASNSCANWR
mmetsp:Transcript_47182/g.119407  ORF Transcript_47182/g.119407 Transcript_47182/m.119407 type:complete len:201 (-) Transcript_47182:1115-1717(-)